ncbi:hypothetical protein BD408DRAFT_426789 [Parasitella parasitica]|nr:hypothetical protein BD408DRAFT_426789 [Parasitella parasitica]
MTHENWPKDSLASVRAILQEYINDVKMLQKQQDQAARRLKTSYKDAELIGLIQKTSQSSNGSPQSNIYNNYISDNTIEQLNIVQDNKQSIITQDKGSSGQKRSREQTPEQPSIPTSEQPSTLTRGKRNCRSATDKNFVSSEIISDHDTNSNTTSSPSSFFPSDLMDTPVGYTCRIEICELGDFSHTPLPIRNSQFAALVASAKEKCDESQLFPTDCLTRLHASTIFKTDGPFLLSDGDDNDSNGLPENIYKNIHAFKRAMQRRTLYIQPHPYTTLKQMAFDNIITSTYLLHGKPRVKCKGSELSQVALSVSTFLCPLFSAHDQVQVEFDNTSWVFKQQDDIEIESLRPDIIFYFQQQEEVVEIGCGEVKKPGASQALLDKDKMRVLEMMKRQLHLRLCRAKKEYEAVTFGILVQGTMVILLQMQMDLENGVYMYHEEQSFTLPTTYHTYVHMDIALEVINKFKDQMLNSLLKVEDHDCESIWDLYKPHVRPTVSCFEPIYHS